VLRHVSDAFREDPLRVLRGCRFLAQLGELGFQWAPETLAACKSMGRELTSLSSERVIQEMMTLLSATQPERGVHALHDTGALAELLPEIQHLPAQFQMEGAEDRLIEWALAHHPTTACLDSVIRRFRLPQTWHQHLMAAVTLQSTPHDADADTRLTVMQQLGWLRGSPPDGELDVTLGRLDALAHFPITLSTWLKHRTKVRAIHVQDLAFEGLQGAALGSALRSERLRVLSTEISAPGTAPGL
jgi:tRNA nucleotidyltransferase (CCA-adding enzyme)